MSAKKTHSPHRLIVQPDDGPEPVVELLASAKRSLRSIQFTLDDARFIDALLAAHKRGVDVRILLNPHKNSGQWTNDATFERLKRAGVDVEWTNPRFAVTHQKTIVVDDVRGHSIAAQAVALPQVGPARGSRQAETHGHGRQGQMALPFIVHLNR